MPAVAKQGAASVRAGTKRRVATPTAKVSGVAQQAAKAAVALSAAVGVSTGAAFAGDHKVIAGADDGSLVFEPNEITIKAGETIDFVNNKAGPHNVQFDEDGVPSGVDPDSITYEDYMNSPGEVQSVTFKVPGDYEYICTPHAGAGMGGKVHVKE